MALRKAIGTVKDQTSIGLAMVASNMAPDLEMAVVKATSHDEDPADEKYVRAIASLMSRSSGHVHACVAAVSKRLSKTRDWVVALKSLMLVHRLLCEGDPFFQQELMHFTRKGARVLNLSGFSDEAHSSSWDHTAFVRTYAMYLDQKLELLVFERNGRGEGSVGGRGGDRFEKDEIWMSSPNMKVSNDYDYGGYIDTSVNGRQRSRSYGDVNGLEGRRRDVRRPVTPLREMKLEKIFARMRHLQTLLDRFLACQPTGLAKSCRMVLIALYPVVRESFQLYADICDVLATLLDNFFDMEYEDCVKAFDAYASTAKQIDDLIMFYSWCRDVGVGRSSEYPEVQRITAKLLETLEEFVRDRSNKPRSPEKIQDAPPVVTQAEEPVSDRNEIKALPAPEEYAPPPPLEPEPQAPPQVTGDLVDLTDEMVSADDQGNKLALALFAEPSTNGSWDAFSSNGQPEVTSAWQTPAAEPGKADWELALVESASNLTRQKPALGGGLDPLLLNGMYDQGIVRQHVATAQLTEGSASSVVLPGPKSSTPVLYLPAPDGSTIQTIGQDPFAASLTIPPPSYVQMADMERKQVLLTQEQLLWQHYAREGMQGPATLAKLSGQTHYVQQMLPYRMPPTNGVGPPAKYYSPH